MKPTRTALPLVLLTASLGACGGESHRLGGNYSGSESATGGTSGSSGDTGVGGSGGSSTCGSSGGLSGSAQGELTAGDEVVYSGANLRVAVDDDINVNTASLVWHRDGDCRHALRRRGC
jgi:hypothetical protein